MYCNSVLQLSAAILHQSMVLVVQIISFSWSVGWIPLGVQRTFYPLSPFPSRCVSTVFIILIWWAKIPWVLTNIWLPVSFSKLVLSYCSGHVYWISFVFFLLAIVSSSIHPTILLYAGLGLASSALDYVTRGGVQDLYIIVAGIYTRDYYDL